MGVWANRAMRGVVRGGSEASCALPAHLLRALQQLLVLLFLALAQHFALLLRVDDGFRSQVAQDEGLVGRLAPPHHLLAACRVASRLAPGLVRQDGLTKRDVRLGEQHACCLDVGLALQSQLSPRLCLHVSPFGHPLRDFLRFFRPLDREGHGCDLLLEPPGRHLAEALKVQGRERAGERHCARGRRRASLARGAGSESDGAGEQTQRAEFGN